MIEYICKYELSLKLKEIGFDENCIAYYNKDGKLFPIDTDFVNFRGINENCVMAPLYIQVIEWIKNKNKRIDIVRLPYSNNYALSYKSGDFSEPSTFLGAFKIEECIINAIEII